MPSTACMLLLDPVRVLVSTGVVGGIGMSGIAKMQRAAGRAAAIFADATVNGLSSDFYPTTPLFVRLISSKCTQCALCSTSALPTWRCAACWYRCCV